MKTYHDGMDFKEFKIGQHFYTACGGWIVTDIGTRTVVARRSYERHWDDASNEVFCWYDFGGCSRKPQKGVKKALPNDKVNRAVARALGWQSDGPEWTKTDGRVTLRTRELPAYTTDMKAAWEIVEHITKSGGCPALVNDDNGHWALSLEGTQTVPFTGRDAETIQTAFWIEKKRWADSAPLAICKAFFGRTPSIRKSNQPTGRRPK
jgi:hypothetical protein